MDDFSSVVELPSGPDRSIGQPCALELKRFPWRAVTSYAERSRRKGASRFAFRPLLRRDRGGDPREGVNTRAAAQDERTPWLGGHQTESLARAAPPTSRASALRLGDDLADPGAKILGQGREP